MSHSQSSSSSSGFSLVEVVVSLALTLVVLGAVFGLLMQGTETPRIETERADAQAQARNVLESVSEDILAAGTNLPPEFPSFVPEPPSLVAKDWTSSIEIVRTPDARIEGETWPIEVLSFEDTTVKLASEPADYDSGDLLLIYDDAPVNGKWMFAIVNAVRPGNLSEPPALDVELEPKGPTTSLPVDISKYNRPRPVTGWVIKVEVVRYFTQIEGGAVPAGFSQKGKGGLPLLSSGTLTLMRSVNWGRPEAVATVEDFQVRYAIGSTIYDPGQPPYIAPKRPSFSPGSAGAENSGGMAASAALPPSRSSYKEIVRSTPPVPQPDPGVPVTSASVVAGVLVTVTSRSQSANLKGATLKEGDSVDADGYLRTTLSSRTTPRNLLQQFSARGDSTFN